MRARNLLRGLDLTRPDARTWGDMMAMLRHALGEPAHEIDALVEELDAALAHWPEELRHDSPPPFDDEPERAPFRRLVRTVTIQSSPEVHRVYSLFPSVRHIHLDRVNGIESEDLRAVLAPPPDVRLSTLTCVRCGLCDPDLLAFAGSAWDALEHFALWEDDLTDDAMHDFVSSLPPLVGLGLFCGPRTAKGLATGSALRSLSMLHVRCSLDALTDLVGGAWERMETLRLGVTPPYRASLPRGWASVLTRSPMVRGLRELDLLDTKVSTEDVELLARTELDRLESLSLMRLTDRGARALAAAPWAPRIKRLFLPAATLSPPVGAALRAALPSGALEIPGVREG